MDHHTHIRTIGDHILVKIYATFVCFVQSRSATAIMNDKATRISIDHAASTCGPRRAQMKLFAETR